MRFGSWAGPGPGGGLLGHEHEAGNKEDNGNTAEHEAAEKARPSMPLFAVGLEEQNDRADDQQDPYGFIIH